MLKACSRCGRIHAYNYVCNVGRYTGGKERALRNKYAWATKAKEVKEKAGYLCEVCRDKGIYTYSNLETHHIDKVKDAPTKLLDNLNLVCLCTTCHKLADAGKLDKEYLRKLAAAREES